MTPVITTRSAKFYSPLRYPGGKASLSNFLFEVIDHNEITDCRYIEPYAGGAGAALTLLFLEKVDRIVINDFDNAIFAFWCAVLYESERFIEKILSTNITVSEWRKQKSTYADKSSPLFELGFSAFFLNRTNHSGILSANPIGGLEQTGKWGIDARFNKGNLIDRIKRIAQYNSRIEISRFDGIDLMKENYNKPNTLFYIDPPYYSKGSSLYLNCYGTPDHRRLASFLNENPNFNWLLTYDNVIEISDLYPDRKKFVFDLNYHINKPRRGTELLIHSDCFDFIV